MAHESRDNEQRLREGGLIKEGPLPDEYAKLVEGLSDEHVNALVEVRKRLDEVESGSDRKAVECMFPP